MKFTVANYLIENRTYFKDNYVKKGNLTKLIN